ncbi:UvrD-helicase domain-containing protein [Adlercreutzia sp. R25]|uniref:DNA 3'-5' helicase n=1 Tax=Adlercreutzia shanghongiae TaxID=3111773 RepID=A0ABU6IXS7_9ACTN|nr:MULTISPECIES: UvrD-helicase domain-containing protein [unclassified Adlercreutzia]MEC4272618.1 UvrD-helicase domain-containing protein [Adlercreutzia sp. R25]MEC4294481.1 UvrD-helicase domain-containing protein [Adlercreutzia sp. R22]
MNLERCTKSQRSVVTTLDAPLMVSAGAGSGKTFTLTQRVAYALAPGDGSKPHLRSVDEVLAITFTKKAAGELKGRIKSLLLAEGLYDEALKVDGAWVSTIHGMASRILREHALEIGIDPAFEVVEGAERDELLAQAIEQVIAEAEVAGDPLLGKILLNERLGGDGQSGGLMEQAQAILARVYAMPDRFEGLDAACAGFDPGALLRRACAAADAMLVASEAWAKPGKTKLAFIEKLKEACACADEWLAAEGGGSFADVDFDTEAFCRVFYGFPLTTGAATGKDKPDFDEWQKAMIEVEREVRAGAATSWLLAVVSLAKKVDAAFSAIKGASRLDNNDLLAVCARALREHPAIAERLRRTFKIIMVDEFQDTDRMQVDIIGAIAQPGFSNVCTVGDAQQSIYRFRGADVNVFEEYRRDLIAHCGEKACESLDWNFRSHGDILAFVERIFSDGEVFGDDFLRLEAHGAVNDLADPLFAARPRIRVNVVQRPWKGVDAGDALDVSAQAVAEHFAELAEAGARAADMVLLLGRMANAHLYAAALRERGLASMITGGSVFSQMPEPALVSALLRFAVNGRDDKALFQVLASPLFALSDDVLLALASRRADDGTMATQALSSGFASPTLGEDVARLGLGELDTRLLLEARSALAVFARRARAGFAGAALEELFVASGLLDRLEAEGVEGLAAGGNLAKSLHLVREMQRRCQGIASLSSAFDAHLATAKEAPGALATAEGDFVRIMTVHASKGLEFPHVAVADLKDGREDTGRLVVENIGRATYAAASFLGDEFEKVKGTYDRTAAKLADDLDGGSGALAGAADFAALEPGERYAVLSGYAEDQALAEARRLLYVALTRASRSLFVALQLRRNLDKGYEGTGVFEDIYRAVPWEANGGFSIDRIDYGGSASAEVRFRFLAAEEDEVFAGAAVPDEEGACDGGAVDAVSAAAGETSREADSSESDLSVTVPPFAVTRYEALPAPVAVPRNFARAGLFSYSSISGSHADSDEPLAGERPLSRDERGLRPPALAPADAKESESATALGTAFHRLAQQAIELSERGALFSPGEAAIVAQIQKESLSAGQQERLRTALDRWLGSDAAARFAAYENRRAEVPFTVHVPASVSDCAHSGAQGAESGAIGGGAFYLEGEIDGLADNGEGAALLIDYKTGGREDETPEQLDAKHRLQASCYAYALMRAGYTSVDAHFLRIEHASLDNPRDPQIVPYHFEKTDLPALEALIITKQQEAIA